MGSNPPVSPLGATDLEHSITHKAVAIRRHLVQLPHTVGINLGSVNKETKT